MRARADLRCAGRRRRAADREGAAGTARCAFVHSGSQVFVEVDEHQHFTSWRLRTLELYPRGVDLGFDLDTYVGRRRSWSERSDRYRASKAAIAFGEGGRQRQRAYYDALRDLVTPVEAGTPLVRAAAPD